MANGRSLPPSDFEGASLEQMRSWVHGGAGAEAAHRIADSWRAEEQYMRDLSRRVQDRMKAAGVSIQGQAGEAMQNAVSPVVLWTEVSADNAQAQAQRLQSQGEAFAKVQSSVPAPGEEQHPPEDNFLEQGWAALTGGKTDNELAVAHNEKLRQDAITAFRAYDNTSQGNVQSSAVFTAPPQAGQPAPAPVSTSGAAAGGGGSASGAHHAVAHGHGGAGAGAAAAHHGGAGAHGTGSAGAGLAPSGTNPSGAAPAPNEPWQQGTLPAPSSEGAPGAVGGLLGAGGAVGGGYAASRGGAGGSSGAGGAGGSARGSAGSGGSGGAGRGSAGEGGSSGRGGAGAAAETAAGSAANRKNASGAAAGGAPGAPGTGGDDEDEHYSPEFLRGDHGFFDDGLPQVAPPVLGQEREPDH